MSNIVCVYVFYYMPNKNARLNRNTVNNLGKVITDLYKQPVQLRLIRLYYPFLDAYILAQWIRLNRRDYKFNRIIRRLFNSVSVIKSSYLPRSLISNLPSHIVGLKIRVSGRLVPERSRPRFTVQTVEIGTFTKNKLSLIDTRTFTSKNKKNAYTVKVWINQQANSGLSEGKRLKSLL